MSWRSVWFDYGEQQPTGNQWPRLSVKPTLIVRSTIALLISVVALSACTSGDSDGAGVTPAPPFDEAFAVALDNETSASLTFTQETDLYEGRGVAWRLEQWTGEDWKTGWILGGETFTIEEWTEGGYDVGDVGVFGEGPDSVPLPSLETDSQYRICHGLNDETISGGCATVALPGDGAQPPFDVCSTEPPPEPDNDGTFVIREVVVEPGGELVFEWVFPGDSGDLDDANVRLVGNEMTVSCWTGTGWETVWGAFDVFRDARSVLARPGVGLEATDDGFTERVGTVVVPPETPPGTYLLGSEQLGVTFNVVAS